MAVSKQGICGTHIAVALMVLFFPRISRGDEPRRPDFYIVFRDCQSIGVGPSGGSVKTMDAPESSLACWRRSEKVPCIMTSGEEQKEIIFTVDADIPPLLTLVQGEHAGDFVAVDTVQHTATLLTRVLLGGSGVVAKVCSGVFATAFEVDQIKFEQETPAPKSEKRTKSTVRRTQAQ
ncbi:hypothetical protein [Pyxidicoccus caerfyrddinensis]|uniref:hypothetical protein n=1 Tax=Pyxidicoccus caerfyrddinensis TaxID=2709663 RepID=UPI0013DC1843|nr:hypothetical protein [Pyxidicoccus caerfyrddinensis]